MASGVITSDNGYEVEEIASGITIFRSGNLRVLNIAAEYSILKSVTLSEKDRPINGVGGTTFRVAWNATDIDCAYINLYSNGKMDMLRPYSYKDSQHGWVPVTNGYHNWTCILVYFV